MEQAEVNIGILGHVDHGKTSITKELTGVWTDTHSEELKRGITIRLGYADVVFRKCPNCAQPECYTTTQTCKKCGSTTNDLRKVSFLDAPGHETLMTTAIAASNIIDGAILVIAANEECPQPQTLEHLMVLDILGVQQIVIVQNKIDLVDKNKALEHYKQIQTFIRGSIAENAPIIPIAANYGINIDSLIEEIQNRIHTPKRDISLPPKMYIARSFDVNRPGSKIETLVGGVIGGSLIQGKLSVGDEVEIKPGLGFGEKGYESIFTTIESINVGKKKVEEAIPGGLIAIGTKLDPSITKADAMVGNLVGKPGTLPPITKELRLEFHFLKRVDIENPPLKTNEALVLNGGTTTCIGFVEKIKKNELYLNLKRPICIDEGMKIAICRRIKQRWRLSGYGIVK